MLKVGDLVQNLRDDYSEVKGTFTRKPIPALSVGRVKRVTLFPGQILVDVKFWGHSIVNFNHDELRKVQVVP